MVAYIKGELDGGRLSEFEKHIAQCTDCQTELEGARKVAAVADQASDEPIERIADAMLEEGIKRRASDIHIQPLPDKTVVRYRIDGVLYDAQALPRYVLDPLVTRIKQLGGMNLAEKRLPQDGRIAFELDDREYDLRVSVVPALLGESVVMRILDKGAVMLDLSDIFTDEKTRGQVEELLRMPAGLVCCTGPTGSGKTTTLYAMLQHLNRRENNLMSVEDPVEYQIDGVTQIRVNQQAGLNFSTAMRHILRQDPDVILCGEIRDMNTLQTVIQAALTGHLVLTTLHTNDVIGAIRRMIDIGVERFLVSSSLTGVLAQRLLRKVCPDCAAEREPTEEETAWLQASGVTNPPAKLVVGEGCDKCRGTGVRGRVAAHEVLIMDPELREAIAGDMDIREVEALAASKLEPMRNDAARRVLAGEVDIAEVMRVLAFMPGYE
jgi:type II secretory ATPase GspE/PulE/Tfp pilus assembly ATPase PilB-like protein